MRTIIQNQDGISVIVGAMLLLVILTFMYTTVQVTLVPIQNAALEFEHFDVAQSDFVKLKSDIEDVGIHNIPKSSDIHMGFRYPNRMIFLNPGIGKFGSLTSEPVNITVKYTVRNTPTSRDFTSSRIIYDAQGMAQIPKLVYEHGTIIGDFGDRSIELSEKSIISGDDIFIPIVSGAPMSLASMDVKTLNLEPYGGSYTIRNVKDVRISIDTNYPEVWKSILSNANTLYDISVSGNSVSGYKIIISSPATQYIVFPVEQAATDAIYAGIITIDSSKPYYPTITDTSFSISGKISTITATVNNVTAPYDIHADLADITENPKNFDVNPDTSGPDDIGADRWPLPNSNTVTWHFSVPNSKGYDYGAVTLWGVNTINNIQYVTIRVEKLKPPM